MKKASILTIRLVSFRSIALSAVNRGASHQHHKEVLFTVQVIIIDSQECFRLRRKLTVSLVRFHLITLDNSMLRTPTISSELHPSSRNANPNTPTTTKTMASPWQWTMWRQLRKGLDNSPFLCHQRADAVQRPAFRQQTRRRALRHGCICCTCQGTQQGCSCCCRC